MTDDVPKQLLDSNLAQALRHFGLDAQAALKRACSGDVLADIRVQVGDEIGAVVTQWCGGSDGYECLDEAIGSLLVRKDLKFAVAVCYPDDLAGESIEEARYVWREKPRVGAKSGLMSGSVADLALAISLVQGSPREPGPVATSLATSLAQDDRDTLTVALPHFTATGNARIDVRRRLPQRYCILFIIASHDPERSHFSLDGKGPEVLVVCKPGAAVQSEPPATRVVNLARNPSTVEGTQAATTEILNYIEAGTGEIQAGGTIHESSFAELHEGDWRAVKLISPFLRGQLLELTRGHLFSSINLSAIADIGPTGGTIRNAFVTERPNSKACTFTSLWGQNNDEVQRMRPKAETSVWGHPDPDREGDAQNLWSERSRLLLPVAPYLAKARAMAVRLDEPTLGSLWTNCKVRKPEDEQAEYEEALCVYLNSTIGILSMLGGFKRMGLLFRLESTVNDFNGLPVPNFAEDRGAMKILAAAFDELGDSELLPLPESNACPVRRAIDRAVCEALSISEELAQCIRRRLVREPSVTGKRYQAEERQLSFHMLGL